MDADLKNLKAEEIDRGLIYMFSHKDIDMLIFIRRAFGNVASVYSGERIIKTDILQATLNHYPQSKNFQIEAAINQYCLDRQKTVVWQTITASNTFQIEKNSSKWILAALLTMHEIIGFIGWKNYFKQLIFLTKNRI